jgi:hypothetical protein
LLKPAAEKVIVSGGADPGFAIIWLQSKSGNRDGRETDAMKRLMIAVAALALVAAPVHAQMQGKRGKTEDKKPDDSASKKVDEKAYKAALERIPDPKEKYDPWGVTKPADPAKKPK